MMGTAEMTPVTPKKTPTLSNLGRLSGAIGVVLLVSTPLTWLLTEDFGPLVYSKLTTSVFLLAFYLVTNGDFFARVAGSRSTGLFAMSAVTVLLVLGLVGAANYVAFKHPKEFDLTREQIFTLSSQTTGLLGRLGKPVHVQAFYASYDNAFTVSEDLLARYKTAAGDKPFTYEFIDPQNRPDLVEKYQITEQGPRLVVSSGSQDARAKNPSEEDLTNAIVKVAEQSHKTIYFLTGHGETSIEDGENSEGYKALADAVGAEGYRVQTLNLSKDESVVQIPRGTQVKTSAAQDGNPPKAAKDAGELTMPEDASLVVVAGQQKPMTRPEAQTLEGYLDRGGRMVVMLEPNVKTGLEDLLLAWHVKVQNDMIVDTNPLSRLLGLGAAAPVIQNKGSLHPITANLSSPAVMFTARSLEHNEAGAVGVHTTTLAFAGDTAWGETNLAADGTASRDDKDNMAPLYVGIAANRDDAEGKPGGRLVVFGDSHWANNRYLAMQGNQDFVLNALNWAAQMEDKIAIRPKTRGSSQLFLSGEQVGRLKFLSMDIMPVMLVALGLGIVLIRRQR